MREELPNARVSREMRDTWQVCNLTKPRTVCQCTLELHSAELSTVLCTGFRGVRRIFGGGVPRGGGGGVPRSAKEANNPILLKVQSLQLSFRPAGVSLGGGGGGQGPPWPPPCVRPWVSCFLYHSRQYPSIGQSVFVFT